MMLSLLVASMLLSAVSLEAQAELPTYAEIRADYARNVSQRLPFRADCKLVSEPRSMEAQNARRAAMLEQDRRAYELVKDKKTSFKGGEAERRNVMAAIKEDIEKNEFALEHPPKVREFYFTFVTDGESVQLRWQNSGSDELFAPRPSPSKGNLKSLYSDILVFSYSPHAKEPRYRLWSGNGGQVSTGPLLHSSYKFPPVGRVDSRWSEKNKFSVIDQIMTLKEPGKATVRRSDQSIVIETILSETSESVDADGQQGVMKNQEFLRAIINPQHAPWPSLVERGIRRYFNDKLLNEPYPKIMETTEILSFKTTEEGIYPETIVTTSFEFHHEGKKLPKFSYYVKGGNYDIPYDPVLVETLNITLRDVNETDPGIEYALEFPVGTKYIDRQLDVQLVVGMTEEQRREAIRLERASQAEEQRQRALWEFLMKYGKFW